MSLKNFTARQETVEKKINLINLLNLIFLFKQDV